MESLNVNNAVLIDKVKKIIPEYLNSQINSIKFIGGGSYGKVFKVNLADGRIIAVKAFRNKGTNEKEAKQLKILSQNTSVPMPEVYFVHSDESSAFMCMSFIEGSNALNPAFLLKSKAEKSAFAKDVVAGMLEWQSLKGEKFGDLDNPEYESWHEYYKNEKQEPWLNALEKLSKSGKYSRKNYELLCKATDIFNQIPEENEQPVLIHGDLNIMNIMADKKSFKLSGFIDPNESIWASREYDLFQLRNMWGDSFGLYDEYKSVHALSEYADFKVAYYGAMNEASVRLKGGLIFPLWEVLCNNRLKKEIQKLK